MSGPEQITDVRVIPPNNGISIGFACPLGKFLVHGGHSIDSKTDRINPNDISWGQYMAINGSTLNNYYRLHLPMNTTNSTLTITTTIVCAKA
ncbi:hypothetical protein [Sphaerisporangium sp. NPDC051011]|uniref:hypothetical protein n=1 Tax=Sphaerisporangium sp. NPDC051011 TaxID=3155792 RepID=UPI00340AF32B